MDKIILSRETRIENNEAFIREETETKLTKERIEMRLRDLEMRKQRLKDQNQVIIKEYEGVEREEIEMKDLLERLEVEDDSITELE